MSCKHASHSDLYGCIIYGIDVDLLLLDTGLANRLQASVTAGLVRKKGLHKQRWPWNLTLGACQLLQSKVSHVEQPLWCREKSTGNTEHSLLHSPIWSFQK